MSRFAGSDRPRISVVVRCLNEERLIGRLLTGLARQGTPPYEVIVVDSGSTDASREIALEHGALVVSIRPEDFSFGRALNVGCAKASGDLLVFMSAHVYPVADSYLAELTRPFTCEDVVLSYGRQIGDERTKFSESRVMERWFPAESTLRQGHPFCNNANAAIRKSAWDQYRYNEELTGLEDLEWATRAFRDGKVLAYVAEAPVVHVHQESWWMIRNRYRREAIAYRVIQNGNGALGPLEAAILLVTNCALDARQAFREGILLENMTAIASYRSAQYLGAWLGSRQRTKISEELRQRFYYPSTTRMKSPPDLPGSPIDYQHRCKAV